MKHCRYCYTEIDKRARICPQCHNQLSVLGSFRAFLITAFPILTAIISLGFAGFEKYEKGLVQSSLVQTENQLEVAEVQASVAEEAVLSLSKMLPRQRMSQARDLNPNSTEIMKTPVEQVEDIETELANLDLKKSIDQRYVEKRYQHRIEILAGRQLFHDNQ